MHCSSQKEVEDWLEIIVVRGLQGRYDDEDDLENRLLTPWNPYSRWGVTAAHKTVIHLNNDLTVKLMANRLNNDLVGFRPLTVELITISTND